jgi:hypothetical protein
VSTHREERNGTGGRLDVFGTPGLVEAAMQKAVRQALRRHKLLGESVAVSRDGKVVILPPEEIPDYPEE